MTDKVYDIIFADENDNVCMDFAETAEDCKAYIERFNGTDDGYFKSYRGGIVQVVNFDTWEVVYETEVI